MNISLESKLIEIINANDLDYVSRFIVCFNKIDSIALKDQVIDFVEMICANKADEDN